MIFLLAWRNIWRNKARSIVIMLSVAIGIFAGMGVLALYKGMMKSRIRTVIDSEVGHLQIQHPEFKNDYHPSFVLPDGNLLLNRIQALPVVKIAAPRSIVQGMLVTTTSSAGVQINGVVPELEYAASQLKQKIKTGDGFNINKKNEILIGKKLADKMKLKTGSKLVLTFSDATDNLVSAAFRVAGIYQSGNTPLDELNVYVTMTALNELLLTGDSYHQIAILLKNDEMLTQAAAQLQQLDPSLLVESWKELSPETDLMVKTIDQYSYIIMLIILIALAFGILNTMLMSVLERTREIGMMVALGTSKSMIFLLVFTETIFLTIAGTPIGLFLSWLVIQYFQKKGLDLSGMGEEMLASFGFGTMIYPSFPGEKLFPILMMVIGTAVFSCLLPVVKALRLNPVEALKR